MKKIWQEARLSDKVLGGLLAVVIIGWSATAIHANVTNGNPSVDPMEEPQAVEIQASNMITAVQAREMAVDVVGGGSVSELNLNTADDNATFDVIVNHNEEEFQVILSATDGTLIRLESLTEASSEITSLSGDLTSDEAIEVAREHLETIGMADATLAYSYSDVENGTAVWSIEFRYNGRDLEFYVVKATGEFLKYPTALNDNSSSNNSSSSSNSSSNNESPSSSSSTRPTNPTISNERAIEIANEHLVANGHTTATFRESKMDFEYGRWVWEVEYRYGRGAIEFYICVDDGSIVKFEVDID